MFEFIKSLFRKKEHTSESTCPFLVHAEISDSIVIKEVALTDKPKVRKTKTVTKKPVATKRSTAKLKIVPDSKQPTKADSSNVVQLVPPKKKGRPKKDKNV